MMKRVFPFKITTLVPIRLNGKAKQEHTKKNESRKEQNSMGRSNGAKESGIKGKDRKSKRKSHSGARKSKGR